MGRRLRTPRSADIHAEDDQGLLPLPRTWTRPWRQSGTAPRPAPLPGVRRAVLKTNCPSTATARPRRPSGLPQPEEDTRRILPEKPGAPLILGTGFPDNAKLCEMPGVMGGGPVKWRHH